MLWHRWRKRFRAWFISCLREALREESLAIMQEGEPGPSFRDALEAAGIAANRVPSGAISGAQVLALLDELGLEVIDHGTIPYAERPAIVLHYIGVRHGKGLLQAMFVPQFTAAQLAAHSISEPLIAGVVFTDRTTETVSNPPSLAAEPTGTT